MNEQRHHNILNHRGILRLVLLLLMMVGAEGVWGQVYYTESYSDASTTEGWTTSVNERYTPVILKEDGNYYLAADPTQTYNNGATVSCTKYHLPSGTEFTIEFNLRLGNSNDSNQKPSFTIYDESNTKEIFTITPTQSNGDYPWVVNGDTGSPITLSGTNYRNNSTLSDRPWYRFKISWKPGETLLTITNVSDNSIVCANKTISTLSTLGGLGDFRFISAKSLAKFAIDDIAIYNVNPSFDLSEDGKTETFTVSSKYTNLLQKYDGKLIGISFGKDSEAQEVVEIDNQAAICCYDASGYTFAYDNSSPPTMGTYYQFVPRENGYLTVDMQVNAINNICLWNVTDGVVSENLSSSVISANSWFVHTFRVEKAKTYCLWALTDRNAAKETNAYPTLYMRGFKFSVENTWDFTNTYATDGLILTGSYETYTKDGKNCYYFHNGSTLTIPSVQPYQILKVLMTNERSESTNTVYLTVTNAIEQSSSESWEEKPVGRNSGGREYAFITNSSNAQDVKFSITRPNANYGLDIFKIVLVDTRHTITPTLAYNTEAMALGATNSATLTVTNENNEDITSSLSTYYDISYTSSSGAISVNNSTGLVTFGVEGPVSADILLTLTAKNNSGYISTSTTTSVNLQTPLAPNESYILTRVLANQEIEIKLNATNGGTAQVTLTNTKGTAETLTFDGLTPEAQYTYVAQTGTVAIKNTGGTDIKVSVVRAYYRTATATLTYELPFTYADNGDFKFTLEQKDFVITDDESGQVVDPNQFNITFTSSDASTATVDSRTALLRGVEGLSAITDIKVQASFVPRSTCYGYRPAGLSNTAATIRVFPYAMTWDFSTANYETSANLISDFNSGGSGNGDRQDDYFGDEWQAYTKFGVEYDQTKGLQFKGYTRRWISGGGDVGAKNGYYGANALGLQDFSYMRIPVRKGQQLEFVAYGSTDRFHGYTYEEVGTARNTSIISNVEAIDGTDYDYFNIHTNDVQWQKYIVKEDGYVDLHNLCGNGGLIYLKRLRVMPPTVAFTEDQYEADGTYKTVVGMDVAEYQNPILNHLPQGSTIEYDDPVYSGGTDFHKGVTFNKETGKFNGTFASTGSVTVSAQIKDADGKVIFAKDKYILYVSDMYFDKSTPTRNTKGEVEIAAVYINKREDVTHLFATTVSTTDKASDGVTPLLPPLLNIPSGFFPTITIENASHGDDDALGFVDRDANINDKYTLRALGTGLLRVTATAGKRSTSYLVRFVGEGFKDEAPILYLNTKGETSFKQEAPAVGGHEITYSIEDIVNKDDAHPILCGNRPMTKADINSFGEIADIGGTGGGAIMVKASYSGTSAERYYVLTVPPLYAADGSHTEWNFRSKKPMHILVGNKKELEAIAIKDGSGVEENKFKDYGEEGDEHFWSYRRRVTKNGTTATFRYQNYVNGQNGFIIKETAGMQFVALYDDDYTDSNSGHRALTILNMDNTEETNNWQYRFISLHADRSSFTIPDVPKGAYIDITCKRHVKNSGEHLKCTNLQDLEGNHVNIISIDQPFYDNGDGSDGSYTLQAENDGDVTFSTYDGVGYIQLYHIWVYRGDYHPTVKQIAYHDDNPFESAYDDGKPNLRTISYHPQAGLTTEDEGNLPWAVELESGKNIISSIPRNSVAEVFWQEVSDSLAVEGVTLGENTTQVAHPSYVNVFQEKHDATVMIAANTPVRPFGKALLVTKVYNTTQFDQIDRGEERYVIGLRKQIVHIVPEPEQQYPKTWDFTNIGGGTLFGSATGGTATITDDAASADGEGTNWTAADAQYTLKTDAESYYIPGTVLTTRSHIIQETDGLGFNVKQLTCAPTSDEAPSAGSTLSLDKTSTITIPDLTPDLMVYVASSQAPTLTVGTTIVSEKPADRNDGNGVHRYDLSGIELPSPFSAQLSFDTRTDVYQIGVTNILKPLTPIGNHAWATESRQRAIDHTLTGYFTCNDVRAYTVSVGSYATDKSRTLVQLDAVGLNRAVPAQTGVVLRLDDIDPLSSTVDGHSVPLFVPAITTPAYTFDELGFNGTLRNMLMANLAERHLSYEHETGLTDTDANDTDDHTGTADGPYTRFILAKRHLTWVHSPDQLTPPTHFETDEAPVFYRLYIFDDVSTLTGLTTDDDTPEKLNTLGANKAYLLLERDHIKDALWNDNASPSRRYVPIRGISDMAEEPTPDPSANEGEETGPTYNLHGQAIPATAPLPPGLYIRHGRKVVIR